MKLTAISILILFLLPLVSAIDFTISSPNKASLGDNITVSLNVASSESYDVKIYLTNGDLENFSKIYNSGWKSTFFYISSAFPTQKDFLLNIVRVEQNTSICAKLRTTDKKSISESCNKIKLSYPSDNAEVNDKPPEGPSQNNSVNEESDDNEEAEIEEEVITETPEEETIASVEEEEVEIDRNENDIATTEKNSNNKARGKILINSARVIDSSSDNLLLSKEEKLRMGLIYAFSALCIVLIILLSLGKI